MRNRLLLLSLCIVSVLLPLGAAAQRYAEADSTSTFYVSKQKETHEERRWNNDLRTSIGAPGLLPLLMLNELTYDLETDEYPFTASEKLADKRYYDGSVYFVPPISLEYGRYVNRWLVIGAKASIMGLYQHKRHIGTHKRISTKSALILSTAVSLRFDYLRRDLVSLYSGISVGIGTKIGGKESIISPTLDMTYFGITVGKHIFGFAEIGGGASGVVRCGIGGRF
jgi:hypothetical protein